MNKYINICGKTHNFRFKNDSYNANGHDLQGIVMTSYHLSWDALISRAVPGQVFTAECT